MLFLCNCVIGVSSDGQKRKTTLFSIHVAELKQSLYPLIAIGFKSQNPQSYKPTASSRQGTSTRVPPKRSGSSAGKLTGTGGMGTRSISVGTLNPAVRNHTLKMNDLRVLFPTAYNSCIYCRAIQIQTHQLRVAAFCVQPLRHRTRSMAEVRLNGEILLKFS